MDRRLDPAIESDLFLALMVVQDRRVKLISLTFGHLSRSCGSLESGFNGEPFAPAISGAAAYV